VRAAAEVERGGEEDGGVREEREEGVEAVGGGGVVLAAEEELEVCGRERRRGGWSGGGGSGCGRGGGGGGDSAGCEADEAVERAGMGEAAEHEPRGGGGGVRAGRLRQPGGSKGEVSVADRGAVAPLRRGLEGEWEREEGCGVQWWADNGPTRVRWAAETHVTRRLL